jgi:hypothetical protein
MRWALLVAAFLGAGCSTTLKTAGDSWIGAPINEFVAVAGAPRYTMDMGDGRTAYTWTVGCRVTLIATAGLIERWSSTNCLGIHPVPGFWVRQAP